jgi:hypothetical protein
VSARYFVQRDGEHEPFGFVTRRASLLVRLLLMLVVPR